MACRTQGSAGATVRGDPRPYPRDRSVPAGGLGPLVVLPAHRSRCRVPALLPQPAPRRWQPGNRSPARAAAAGPQPAGRGWLLQLGDFAVSPDHQWLAYSLERQGNEEYQLYLKHLASGNISELPLDRADGSLVWANDSTTLFAISMDESSRPATLWRMQRGTPAVRVYHETDQRFYLHAYRSSSEQWLILASDSKNTSEVRIVPADEPAADWQLLS